MLDHTELAERAVLTEGEVRQIVREELEAKWKKKAMIAAFLAAGSYVERCVAQEDLSCTVETSHGAVSWPRSWRGQAATPALWLEA